MTVPTKTTSSCCNPWHAPAGAFEHVQADIRAGAKNKIGRNAKSARRVIIDILDILHGDVRGIEHGRDDFLGRCLAEENLNLKHHSTSRPLGKGMRVTLCPIAEIRQELHFRCVPCARPAGAFSVSPRFRHPKLRSRLPERLSIFS